MLWVNGTWEAVPGKDPTATRAECHLHFILHGGQMNGEWIMFRIKPRRRGEGRKLNTA